MNILRLDFAPRNGKAKKIPKLNSPKTMWFFKFSYHTEIYTKKIQSGSEKNKQQEKNKIY